MSQREALAVELGEYVNELGLTEPFGGFMGFDGRAYSVLFAVPLYLDGEIRVFAPKFIQVKFRGKYGNASLVFTNIQDAKDFIKLRFVDFDEVEASRIPTKGA